MQEESRFIDHPRVKFFLVSALVFYVIWLGILFMADAIDNAVLLLAPPAPVIAQFLWMRLCWGRAKTSPRLWALTVEESRSSTDHPDSKR